MVWTEQNLYRQEVGQDVHEACISPDMHLQEDSGFSVGDEEGGVDFFLDIAEESEGILDKMAKEETILQCEEDGFVGGGNVN